MKNFKNFLKNFRNNQDLRQPLLERDEDNYDSDSSLPSEIGPFYISDEERIPPAAAGAQPPPPSSLVMRSNSSEDTISISGTNSSSDGLFSELSVGSSDSQSDSSDSEETDESKEEDITPPARLAEPVPWQNNDNDTDDNNYDDGNFETEGYYEQTIIAPTPVYPDMQSIARIIREALTGENSTPENETNHNHNDVSFEQIYYNGVLVLPSGRYGFTFNDGTNTVFSILEINKLPGGINKFPEV